MHHCWLKRCGSAGKKVGHSQLVNGLEDVCMCNT